MISSKVTLLLIPMLFLAMVTAQAEGETNDQDSGKLLSCEELKEKEDWTDDEFNNCVKQREELKKAAGEIAKGFGNLAKGAGGLALGLATWLIVVIVIVVICCCGIPIGITIWCCCCKNKGGSGGASHA